MTKKCSKCGKKKPIEDFPKSGSGSVYAWCKVCHVDVQREYRLKKNFDLTGAEYEKILLHQGGTCAIASCQKTVSWGTHRLAVDHDHRTGLVRGLLCYYHNRLLGNLTPEFVKELDEYLQTAPASVALGEARYGKKGPTEKKKRRRKRRP